MMGKGAKAAAAAAAAAAQAAAETPPVPSPLPANVRHGVMVTIGFFLVYYMFLFAQGTMKRKLRAHYTAQGKKVCRNASLQVAYLEYLLVVVDTAMPASRRKGGLSPRYSIVSCHGYLCSL